jgi:serine/threonine-protein kinase
VWKWWHDPYAPTEVQPLRNGQTLAGRYRLVRLIGEGGMGAVWEARHLMTDKAVAIKLLKSHDGDTARFLREARIVAQLSHRNVVQVFDLWESDGDGPLFMVMELLAGESLGARLGRVGRLSIDETVAVTMPIASGLRAAHAQGVVHRDLKPDNVFLATGAPGEPVEVKVVDFGIAKPTAPEAQATAITETGTVMGTVFYMSPEQVFGQRDVDGRTDVWALGVVIYECITGERPFVGENFGQIFRAISLVNARRLREVAPHAPPWLDELVSRMLTRDRAKRPSMSEVLDVLAAAASSDPAFALLAARSSTMPLANAPPLPTMLLPRADAIGFARADTPTTGAAVAATRPPNAARRRRRVAVIGLAGVATLAGAGLGAAAMTGRGAGRTTLSSPTLSMLAASMSAATSALAAPSSSAPPVAAPAPSAPPASSTAAPRAVAAPRLRGTVDPLERGRF